MELATFIVPHVLLLQAQGSQDNSH